MFFGSIARFNVRTAQDKRYFEGLPSPSGAAIVAAFIALAHDWGMDVGNDVVLDVSGMGQLIGTSESVPVANRHWSVSVESE